MNWTPTLKVKISYFMAFRPLHSLSQWRSVIAAHPEIDDGVGRLMRWVWNPARHRSNVLSVPLCLSDISMAHRLPKQRTDASSAPLIVRFTNRRARNAVYAARKTL